MSYVHITSLLMITFIENDNSVSTLWSV